MPSLQVETLRELPGPETWVWVVNDELVVRFPRPELTRRRAKVDIEARVLRALPPAARAPRLVHLSPDGWSAITKLEGTDGETRRPPTEAWPALAADVRTALDAVHATPPPPGTPRADLPEPRALLEGARRDAALVGVDVTLLSRCLAPDVSRADEALCHADLKPEHVLVDGRDRLAGIIDWADACVCDPVRDLAGVVLWLGPAFVRLVDAEDAERATFYARCFAVENVARSLRGAWGAPLPLVRAQLEAAFREA